MLAPVCCSSVPCGPPVVMTVRWLLPFRIGLLLCVVDCVPPSSSVRLVVAVCLHPSIGAACRVSFTQLTCWVLSAYACSLLLLLRAMAVSLDSSLADVFAAVATDVDGSDASLPARDRYIILLLQGFQEG